MIKGCMKRLSGFSLVAFIATLLAPSLLMADATAGSNATAIDTVWTLIAAILVFFMQAGFALVESGFTRAKSCVNIIMKNLMDFSLGTILYAAVGFGIMFGASKGGFIGSDGFFLSALDATNGDGLWQYVFWLFQAMFAATAATIVSGAMAERTKFVSYLVYSVFITALIYPIVGHWTWGGGWLTAKGFIDFAGSTVVHSVGAWAALAGAIILGPRLGKFSPDGKDNAIPGHNIPMAALGVFILWFGWFGFNAGSTTAGTNAGLAIIAVTTNLSAAAGAFAAMITVWMRYGHPDVSMSLNGALAGLVGITAGCASVSPMAAILIGLVSGVLVVLAVEFIEKTLKVDDPVGAVSVHGVCGAWGTLAVGLFASPVIGGATGASDAAGLFYGGGAGLLVTQLIGVLAVFAWTFGTSYVLFSVVNAMFGLRVTPEEELKGVDISEHAMEAYSGFQIFTTE